MNKKIIASIVSAAAGIFLVQFIMNYDFTAFQLKETVINNQLRVSIPGEFKHEVTNLNTAAGEIKVSIYTCEKNDITYIAAHTEYPEELIKNSDTKIMLDNAVTGSVRNSHGTLLAEEIFSVNSYPGREVKIQGPNGHIMRNRMLLVNNTLYQWGVVTVKEKIFTKAVSRFFDSFKLIENK